jgi:CheY-like chemotaxis protein
LKSGGLFLVEDNAGDVRLVEEALKEVSWEHRLTVAKDGAEAIEQLTKTPQNWRPDIILLDLNLPKKNGFEVLDVIKADAYLRRIPVVVLTASQNEDDLFKAYDLHANCYVTKPLGLDEFLNTMRSLEDFWLRVARLPQE